MKILTIEELRVLADAYRVADENVEAHHAAGAPLRERRSQLIDELKAVGAFPTTRNGMTVVLVELCL